MATEPETGSVEAQWVRDLRAAGDLVDPQGELLLSEAVSVWTFFPELRDPTWYITTRPLTAGAPPKSCRQTGALMIAGTGSTNPNGQREFRVREFSCLAQNYLFAPPPSLLATAATDQPVFLTARADLIQQARDVRLRFFAWDAAGQPVRVSFRWQLIAPAYFQEP